MTWRVAYTAPRAESRVREDITDTLGYQVYAPVELRVVVQRGRKVDVAKPLFPRYIFVRGHTGLGNIKGVSEILDGGVSDAWIDAMRKAEACGVFNRTTANASSFRVGERVRVSDGAFRGFDAVIQEFIAKLRSATARKRAKVLVSFMGRMTATEIDVTDLEKLTH